MCEQSRLRIDSISAQSSERPTKGVWNLGLLKQKKKKKPK